MDPPLNFLRFEIQIIDSMNMALLLINSGINGYLSQPHIQILRQLVGQPAGDQQPSGLRLFAQTIGIADRVNWAGVPDQVPSPHFLVDLIVRRLRVIQSDFDFRPQNYENFKTVAFQTIIAVIDAFIVNFTALPIIQPESLALTPEGSPDPVIPADNIHN
jgi:hypothetical protein